MTSFNNPPQQPLLGAVRPGRICGFCLGCGTSSRDLARIGEQDKGLCSACLHGMVHRLCLTVSDRPRVVFRCANWNIRMSADETTLEIQNRSLHLAPNVAVLAKVNNVVRLVQCSEDELLSPIYDATTA